MNLQRFAEAVKGTKIVYLYRIHENAASEKGAVLAFTTENSRSVSVDADSTVTKDGTIRTPSEPEIEIQATSILTVGDTFINALEAAMKNNKLMDIWEVNLMEGAGTNKFKGTYYQGYLTDFEKSSNAEDFVEVQLTFGINGKGADGNVTVTTEQQAVASYVFSDTDYGLTTSADTLTIQRSASQAATGTVTLSHIVGSTVTASVTGDTEVVSAAVGTITAGGATVTVTATKGSTAAAANVLLMDEAGYTVNVAVTVSAVGG